jgi:hypothetical protein
MNSLFSCWCHRKEHVLSKKEKEYIQKAEEVHGEYYDYSLIKYFSPHSYLEIICPEHGSFRIMASIHLSGGCCKKCNTKNQHFEKMYTYYFPSAKVSPL